LRGYVSTRNKCGFSGAAPKNGVRFYKTVKEEVMKATISKVCMGDRNCNKLCPEVFEYDEDQLLSIVKYDEIPKHLEAIVRQAAAECGANAITIEE
jgi:ferredoxin